MMYKRAVSPLIATVLLVMIVVSIGAAVMVVIQGISAEQISSTEAQQELIKCASDVELSLFKIGTDYRVCVDHPDEFGGNGKFAVFLENRGLRDIRDWRLVIMGSDNYLNITEGVFGSLDVGEIKRINWTFVGNANTEVVYVRLSPQIVGSASNPTVTCSEPNLEWDATDMAGWDDCSGASGVGWDD